MPPLDLDALVQRAHDDLERAKDAYARSCEARATQALSLERRPDWCGVVRRRARHDIARRRRGLTRLTASVHPEEVDVAAAACRLVVRRLDARPSRLLAAHPGLYRVATDALLLD